MKKILVSSSGFTLIELLLVMGITAVIGTFATVNLIRPQTNGLIESTISTLVADIKSQQLRSMSGDSDENPTAESFGIYFETSRYTIFRGSAYSAGDSNNFIVDLDTNLAFSNINLPASSMVFSRRSGEVSNFSSSANSLTLQNSASGQQKTISVNHFGVLTIN